MDIQENNSSTSNSVLIVFIKNPEKGKVKTRLAKTMGNQKALQVYQKLLRITKSITDQLDVSKQIWYSRFIDEDDIWSDGNYDKYLQKGDNLGLRMRYAFKKAFADGYQKVVIIGSDCSALNPEFIEESFKALENNQAVIGPANDGGYYLLGMLAFYPSLFENKAWSTSSVFEETIRQFKEMNISYKQLPMLNDIDTEEDLKASNLVTD
ncbi:TIGR04282 family arsenosugar biosynthesis glycosyltransferase [Fodinibius sp.]|uniref:TIGR04282 family arsenosugar biosynthesis glycosyltransferase n=1 Tax=Fodinibius sp. TaxID=1872440 RepID=UPI002ACDE746|nr:TIGR04282 family arsenosugar biosynthesis glycosyltransferase [Fodinibius sp.]MDZ7658770.1 TIGR04282 family arsenosugar biosynthesis glycosyltransferase [Fodinibius sp.]